MKPLGCAPYPQMRRHPRAPLGADALRFQADGLLLGTDAVDVVVKATAARAGQIAAATENRIAEPAPSTAETSAGSSLFPIFGRAATQCQKLARFNRKSKSTANLFQTEPDVGEDRVIAPDAVPGLHEIPGRAQRDEHGMERNEQCKNDGSDQTCRQGYESHSTPPHPQLPSPSSFFGLWDGGASAGKRAQRLYYVP